MRGWEDYNQLKKENLNLESVNYPYWDADVYVLYERTEDGPDWNYVYYGDDKEVFDISAIVFNLEVDAADKFCSDLIDEVQKADRDRSEYPLLSMSEAANELGWDYSRLYSALEARKKPVPHIRDGRTISFTRGMVETIKERYG